MPRSLAALAASLGFLAGAAAAQSPPAAPPVPPPMAPAPATPPTLDPAGVRGVHDLARDDALTYIQAPGARAMYDWQQVGVVQPQTVATAADMRRAFEGNALQAERRYAEPFMVSGTLHSASRRADRSIVVGFREGGAADGMRRAMPGVGLPEFSDMTGGLATGGAQAVLAADYADTVADWNPGSRITLLCTGASNVRLALLLRGCMPQEAAIARAEQAADAQAELALSRQPLTVSSVKGDDAAVSSRRLLVMGYALGLASKPCRETNATARIGCGMRRADRDKRLTNAIMQQTASDLGLPPPQAQPEQPPARPRPGR